MYTSVDDGFEEPVSLEGLKAYLSLRESDRPDDSYLKGLVSTARAMLEDAGGLERVIVPRSFELSFSEEECHLIMDLYPLLIEVEKVYYTDADGNEQEITEYGVEPGLRAQVWFDYPDDAVGDVTVRFTSGYEEYPPCIILAIKMMCRAMYERTVEDPLTPEVRQVIQSEVIYSL